MSQPSFTPGPWYLWEQIDPDITEPTAHVALIGPFHVVGGGPLGNPESDARLIASARKMYEALRGDPEMPAVISPLSWLKSMIDECKERGPSADCDDTGAYWEMVREVEDLYRNGMEAIAFAESQS